MILIQILITKMTEHIQIMLKNYLIWQDYNITIRWKQQVIWKPGEYDSDVKVIHQGRRIENRRIFE